MALKRLQLPTYVQMGHKQVTYYTEEELIEEHTYNVDDLKGAELKILNNLKVDHEETVGTSKSLS